MLTAFNAAPSVDVGIPGSSVVVSFKATDDMSGVQSIRAWATGPSERPIELNFEASFPSTKLTAKMHTDEGLAFLEPGAYRFISVFIYDYAGNFREFDSAALEALGKTTFTLKNKKGFDRTPPTIVSGKVLTPQISLSATQPGTGNGLFAQVSVVATDAGDTAVAGVRSSVAWFCSHEPGACIIVESNPSEAVPMAASTTLRLGGQPAHHGVTVGQYHLMRLGAEDYAGNYVNLTSTEFGGETDFSSYFPSTTITIVP